MMEKKHSKILFYSKDDGEIIDMSTRVREHLSAMSSLS